MSSARAVLYVRVSTAEQRLDLQLDELRAVARQRGWLIVAEHSDQVSGARCARPGLDQVLALVRRARVDLVAVWRLDRLARSVGHLLELGELLQRSGVDLVSVRDGAVDTTSPTGRLLFTVLGAVAAFERDLIRERVAAGLAAARRRGVVLGRPRRGDLNAEQIEAALSEANGSERAAARLLGVPRSTLRSRRLAAVDE